MNVRPYNGIPTISFLAGQPFSSQSRRPSCCKNDSEKLGSKFERNGTFDVILKKPREHLRRGLSSRTPYHVQFLVSPLVVGSTVQRTVHIRKSGPVTSKIVGHHMNSVHVPVDTIFALMSSPLMFKAEPCN